MKRNRLSTSASSVIVVALLGTSPALGNDGEWKAVPLPDVSGPLQRPGPARPSLQKVPAGTALADYDYEVAEYLVTGEAGGEPYTTRIVVSMPSDRERFSGVVVSEPMHASGNSWMLFYTRLYVMPSGHGHVEIDAQKGPVEAQVVRFNPERYADIAIASDGQANEILAQVGALIKSNDSSSPFAGLEVRKLVMMGTSQSASTLRSYLEVHATHRLANGDPIYDGYMPTSTAGDTPMPRVDVPLIHIPTQTEVERAAANGNPYRRDDGDEPDNQFRLYEMAGMPHNDSRENPTYAEAFCDLPMTIFPVGALMSVGLHHLVSWVDRGVVPPRASRIEVDGDTSGDGSLLALDEHGNARGGVRNTYVDVPIAKYGVPNRSEPVPGTRNDFYCSIAGYEVRLPDETLRSLYRDARDYRDKVDARLRELIDAGWFLPNYADQVTANAMAVTLGGE